MPPLLLAGALVAPLPLATRYPLLAWRIGWLALLLAPLVPGEWRGGWPWGAAQLFVLLVAFCVAGVRYGRWVGAWSSPVRAAAARSLGWMRPRTARSGRLVATAAAMATADV